MTYFDATEFMERIFPVSHRIHFIPILQNGMQLTNELLEKEALLFSSIPCSNLRGRLFSHITKLQFTPEYWPDTMPGQPIVHTVSPFRDISPIVRYDECNLYIMKTMNPGHINKPKYIKENAFYNGNDQGCFWPKADSISLQSERKCVILTFGERNGKLSFARLAFPNSQMTRLDCRFDLIHDYEKHYRIFKDATKKYQEKSFTKINKAIIEQLKTEIISS